jgi:SAM-dependent methyltransferase
MTTLDLPVPDAPLIATATAQAANPSRFRPYFDLLLISFVILFFELACIRFFGSTVIFLTYFTNIVLIACFLGMSVGCLVASRRQNFITWALPLALITVLFSCAVFYAYNNPYLANKFTIDVGAQTTSPKEIYFGTEYRAPDPSKLVIPIYVLAGAFFSLIAIMFVGLGQVLGRAFDALPNRVASYTTNVFGSLLGIGAFFAASWFGTSPHVWFTLCTLAILYFLPRWTGLQIFSQIMLLFIVALVAFGAGEEGNVMWSPYYKIRYVPQTAEIFTNNLSHQQMVSIDDNAPGYALPHLLARDSGNPPFHDILIIGAGSGNDVEAALKYGDSGTHIDAVEIDPVINGIGKRDNPNIDANGHRPFDDPRVVVHYDDGRSFVKKTKKKYDLVIYALVDSLVLHSGYSSLRLESFLFTQEAFADVQHVLKPDGVFCMYNYYRQGWVVGRLQKMAQKAFGTDPIVISLPYFAEIHPQDNQSNVRTFVIVGNGTTNPLITSLRTKFASPGTFFWVHDQPKYNANINGFSPTAPTQPADAHYGAHWNKFAPAAVDVTGIDRLPSDDWPFLYLQKAEIPFQPSVQGIITIAVLSLVILLAFAPVRRIHPNGQMFFLGAGFMLLETKGVVHMALLFGSTWMVNSFVFAAILVMILLANLYVLAVRPQKLWPYYLLLIATLLVNGLVPMSTFLQLENPMRTIVSCGVIFIPVFFAGVIFATSFRDSKQPDIDMGSNIAGVILGGLSEYLSLMVGFQYLLLVAIGFYLLALVLRPRLRISLPAAAVAG